MGIVETSGVSFTTFQLRGPAYQWWRAYELSSPDEAASLTWTQFSELFFCEYVPQSLRDAWRIEFEQLHQGSMTMSEYVVHFSWLARHTLALVATVRERVRRFIEGLHPSIRTSVARELEIDITYQQAVSIARRVKAMFARDREEKEAERSQETGHYSGARAPAARYGRGFLSHPVHSALPAASSVPAPPRPPKPYYALLVSSMSPTRGAITGQSSRPVPSQSQPPRPPRGCFECGDTHHLVRDFPRARRGAPPQTYQPPRVPSGPSVILPAPAATLPPQLARACVVARSSLYDSIRKRQYDDPHLLVLQEKVRRGDARDVTIGNDSVMRMQGRICVPNVDGLRE
ncbi:uncharacterized protein [Nicotiana tomentosiformis]|uniref:uncharacterized protein n=1 Tax=Nicotiana tomentosiformis TaxID=4098 RepID=UPI00388CCD4A